MDNIAAKRYARALFETVEISEAPAVLEQFDAFMTVLQGVQGMQKYMFSPSISRRAKATFLAQVLQATFFTDPVKNFLLLLHRNNRLNLLPAIGEIFEKYMLSAQNKLKVLAFSACKIDKAVLHNIQKVLEGKFRKEILLDCRQDKTLLGGIKLQVDSLLCDATVKKTLNQLQQFIKK